MNYFHLYGALAVLLITALALNVSFTRIKEKIGNGDGNNKKLRKAIRAHINTLEHVIPFALLLLVLSQLHLSAPNMAFYALGFLAVRFTHSYGILFSQFKMRQVAAGLCYLFEVAACLTIVFKLL